MFCLHRLSSKSFPSAGMCRQVVSAIDMFQTVTALSTMVFRFKYCCHTATIQTCFDLHDVCKGLYKLWKGFVQMEFALHLPSLNRALLSTPFFPCLHPPPHPEVANGAQVQKDCGCWSFHTGPAGCDPVITQRVEDVVLLM